jgi:hypothetical protein
VQKRIGPPKSGKVRSVPLGGEVAATLARLATASRWTGHDDLVFAGDLGGFLDGSALRRRAALTIPCRRW